MMILLIENVQLSSKFNNILPWFKLSNPDSQVLNSKKMLLPEK